MSADMYPHVTTTVIYPTSDGEPMADNTKQFRWIQTIHGGLDALFRDRPDVFVAGDLLWYAVEGRPDLRRAPDAMVIFGRPKGDRGAYLQWEEGNIAPQVVFEILSPGNTSLEMAKKFAFYDKHGVEEYYLYDPDTNDLRGWRRIRGRLTGILQMHNWVSPRLGIRFVLSRDDLTIYRPDGMPFVSYAELDQQRLVEQERAAIERERAEREQERAERAERHAQHEREQAEQERKRTEALLAYLETLGIPPPEL